MVLRNKWLWLKQQINVSKTAAPEKLVIHSGSLGTGQIDLKSAIVVIRQNSQMAVMARTKVTIQEVTSTATKVLIVIDEERSSVLVHFLNSVRTKLVK